MSEDTVVVVLVEGESDRGAVEALSRRLGHDPDTGEVIVVSMGGIANIAHYLKLYWKADRLAVLCDAAEAGYARRAIGEHPGDVGLFVCDADLEDELIRSVGLDWMLDFIDRQGELATFHLMQRQPEQRERSLAEQIHRFMGIKSGRKARYATDLAGEIPLDSIPDPLAGAVVYVFGEPS